MATASAKRKTAAPRSKQAPPTANTVADGLTLASIDVGNAAIKAVCNNGKSIAFPHAFIHLSEREWETAMLRGNTYDYYTVNGQRYVVGETAERNHHSERRLGAARYTRDYYGVLGAIALYEIVGGENDRSARVTVMGMHAPEYISSQNDIRESISGAWVVAAANKPDFKLTVKNVFMIDEPVGGTMKVVMNANGTAFSSDGFSGEGLRGLTIDVGGWTLDTALAYELVPSPDQILSMPNMGILNVMHSLRMALRNRYPHELRDVSVFPQDRLREAIRTGIYRAGSYGNLPCGEEVDDSARQLLTDTYGAYSRAGGGTLDYVILTGGGSGALESHLREALGHNRVWMASKANDIHMANAEGGLKMLMMMAHQGKIR